MYSVLKLKQLKRAITRMADANDPEMNKIIQDAVTAINKLILKRGGNLAPHP